MPEKKVEKDGHISLRPTPTVKQLLEEAQKVTGSDRSELILRCIEDAIQRVVDVELEKQAEELKQRQEELRRKKAAKN